MSPIAWLSQTDKPAFEDLLWSRPENKSAAGKIVIIGGNKHDMFAPLSAFAVAARAGVGEATVLTSEKAPAETLGSPGVNGLPATKSGALSVKAKEAMVGFVQAADLMLWPGSLGRDSESTQLLESILDSSDKPTVLCGDAVDVLIDAKQLHARAESYLVATLQQLRSLQSALGGDKAITLDIQLTNLVELLSDISHKTPLSIATLHGGQLIGAVAGKVAITKLAADLDKEEMRWRVPLSALGAVLLAQFPTKPYEALTSAAWLYRQEYDE